MSADRRKQLSAPRPVTVKASDLSSILDGMSNDLYAGRRIQFTKEQDELLVKHRARGLSWRQLAPAFGVHENTLRRRWQELTGS